MLGLALNKDRDTLSVAIPTIPSVWTKRGILAKLARIYDPLGFPSPLTLAGKLIYRAACDNKNAWDAPLTEAIAKLWKGGTLNFHYLWKRKDPCQFIASQFILYNYICLVMRVEIVLQHAFML